MTDHHGCFSILYGMDVSYLSRVEGLQFLSLDRSDLNTFLYVSRNTRFAAYPTAGSKEESRPNQGVLVLSLFLSTCLHYHHPRSFQTGIPSTAHMSSER